MMLDRVLADVAIAAHFAFLVFVVAGGFLARRWRWLAAPHLLAAAWGVYVEVADAPCPLTRLENRYARSAGRAGYDESFIEHHLMPIIYPAGLTRRMISIARSEGSGLSVSCSTGTGRPR